MSTAIYPGSFDPVTLGHMDVISRTRKLFPCVTVAVAASVNKRGRGTAFTLEERVEMLRQALAEARRAFDLGEVPIGAVVVWGDRIVGRGHNLVETLNDPTAHAEMQAITAATASVGGKYLSECRLYVTVEPCVMCAGACYWSQVGSVIYGAADPKRGVSTVSQAVFHPKTTVRGGILEAECGELVSSFFRKLRK